VGRYVARRLLVAVPTLLVLSFLIFTLVSAAPGDPAQELADRLAGGGNQATPADVARARHELHLDRPFWVQYGTWLKGLVTGDLGLSFSKKRPVSQVVAERVRPTVEVASTALALILVLSIPLGIVAAVFHRRWPDQLLRVLALIGASMPSFFFAYLLIILFVTRLHLLPVAGRVGWKSLVMPAVVVAVVPTAVISRLLRSSLLEVLGEDYVRTARSKGAGRLGVIVRHTLRNAAIPVVTYLGTVLGYLLEGVIITEFIFAWPGLGSLTFEAISQRDYPVIQAVVMLSGAVYLAVNLAVDVSYALLDPRIRLEGSVERV
jgi:peptide/nickel transport system permease protein